MEAVVRRSAEDVFLNITRPVKTPDPKGNREEERS